MKLQQLKYLKAVKDNNLNISAASESLYTTQPGVSKQILLFEQEMGVRIFERHGKHLQRVTDIGEKIFLEVEKMLILENKIKSLASEYVDPGKGSFNIYTTHTIASYLLPHSVAEFTKRYPNVNFNLFPTIPSDSRGGISKGHTDFSIVAQVVAPDSDLIVLPAYLWRMGMVVHKDHPLAKVRQPTAEQIAQHPLLSYEPGATGRECLDKAMREAGCEPKYFMSAMDADVIKRYVNLNFGVGIISNLAATDITNTDLVYINLDHLLDPCKAWICFSKDVILHNYMYDFLGSFSPHLTKQLMEEVIANSAPSRINTLFKEIELPVY
ncbi:LysR substrate-binding domain-containing protein [Vibrio zhugei]|uniref:LysR substrate-binding domain-containing protein n=1 Tax=Vibrio zhugei TaxID=2479546 RepID=A0ABV7C8H2_9VIBR|nr:LysR substrate-binding domain-containing protein [Vibrio zhugei]